MELDAHLLSLLPQLPPMDRKIKKPLMEKRRRARINGCLGELKVLLMEALQRDPAQTSKLEKADILEMTVHLLRSLERHRLAVAAQLSPRVLQRFQAGWSECQEQVLHYARHVEGFDPQIRERLETHLCACLAGLNGTRRQMEMVAGGGLLASFPTPPNQAPGGSGLPRPNKRPCDDESDEEEDGAKDPKVWRPW